VSHLGLWLLFPNYIGYLAGGVKYFDASLWYLQGGFEALPPFRKDLDLKWLVAVSWPDRLDDFLVLASIGYTLYLFFELLQPIVFFLSFFGLIWYAVGTLHEWPIASWRDCRRLLASLDLLARL